MSDEGEKTCPLCAEEMDLTDQQLKPCKCGYEICVWCWHHIMEMAEKDETEGRCPACRTPYDKEKIVGTATKCERVVAEYNMEKKKSQKTKSKSSEGRKQLSSVRVIQRNLVYIVGLPLNLADEDLLLRREYFGQYGKVLKVSMSRTAAGVIQQFPNNTCSVYITYSKEEEAIRCIQSVHGFILEGRPLRACFGTTKYCHAWLRNVPCTNPDCLYLHEIGSQEDSFTKDEVISAYTRSRVQQITGAANNQLRRSGNILPPPLDDYNSNCSTGKPIIKNASSNMASARGSPPNGSSGRPNGLPPAASWASRASNSHPQSTALTCSNELLKPAPDTASSGPALSSGVATTAHESNLPGDASENPTLSGENHLIQSKDKTDMLKSKQYIHINPCSSASEKPSTFNGAPPTAATSNQLLSPASRESDRGNSLPSDALNTQEPSAKSSGSDPVEDSVCSDGNMQNLWSDFSSLNIKQNGGSEYSGSVRLDSSLSEDGVTNSSQNKGKQTSNINCSRESPTLQSARKFSPTMNGLYSPSNQLDSGAYSQSELQNICPEVEEDVLAFNNQRLKDPEVVSRSPYIPNSSYFLSGSNHSRSHSFQRGEGFGAVNTNVDPLFVNNNISDGSSIHTFLGSLISDGVSENLVQSSSVADSAMDHSLAFHNLEREKHLGMHQGNKTISNISVASDSGESSIISNILSLDLDPFDEPLTSPNNLAKLLGETDRQPGSLSRIPSSRKVQNNSQSRFSFARHEESEGPAFNAEPHYSVFGEMSRAPSLSLNSSQARDMFVDRLGVANGFSSHSFTECNNLGSNHPTVSSMKHSASRAPISAPPGFAVPSRAPPGFTAQERVEQTYDMTSGNHLLDVSSLSRNSYQAPTGSVGNTSDLEFYDPAILTVVEHRQQNGPNNSGLDVRSNYPSQFNFENEARLQLLMQRSLPQHQNLRYSDIKDNYSLVNDSYGITPRFLDQSQVNLPGSYGISTRLLDQTQVNNMSPFGQLPIQQSRNSLMSNGQWNGVQGGNSLSIAELLRNERLGFDKFYTGYEDTKFRMHTSGDLYNRTFGL